MRISDWSSEVCSSDLEEEEEKEEAPPKMLPTQPKIELIKREYDQGDRAAPKPTSSTYFSSEALNAAVADRLPKASSQIPPPTSLARSEQRRVGNACCSPCNSGRCQMREKKKHK